MPWRLMLLLSLCLLGSGLSPPHAAAQQPRTAAPVQEDERGFALEQNYPNPVNPNTWIPFSLEPTLFERNDSVIVSLRIYNVLRQLIAVPEVEGARRKRRPLLATAFHEPGRNVAYWNGRDLAGKRVPSGVYYAELVVNEARQIGKMIVVNPRQGRRRLFPWFGRDRSP